MTQNANPDNPMNPTGQQLRVPTREKVNEQQVHTALAVLNHLQPYLLAPMRGDDDWKQEHPELDGNALASATTTFGRVCDRLDKMMGDDNRWISTDGDSVVESIKNTQASIQKYYGEQALAVAELRRPSRIFHPSFAKMGEKFSAFYASSDFPGGILIGLGNTPAEAMADFDAAFNRIPAEQLRFNEESIQKLSQSGIEVPEELKAPRAVRKKKKKNYGK